MRPLALLLCPCLIAACGVEKPVLGAPETAQAPSPTIILGSALTVEWRSEPTPIPINEPFELYVRALDHTGAVPPDASLSVEGWMPGHGHGMLRQPVAVLQPDGWFRVRGMLFHMAGDWELRTRVGWREDRGEQFTIQSAVTTFEVHL